MRRFALVLAALFAFIPCARAQDEVIVFENEFDAFYQSLYDEETTDVWEAEIPEEEMMTEDTAPQAAGQDMPEPQGSAEPFVYTRVLKYGMEGDDVRQTQERLAQLGYFTERATGGYYKKTREAVKKFQRQNALSVDGTAGKETLNVLFGEEAVPASATPKPTATPSPPQYHLFVDVTNQITRAYALDEKGEYTVLVREMICSTGTRTNPTPIKKCTLPGKRARWGYFPEWGSHAQYLTRIDSSNAFHSVLYSSPNEKELVVSSFEKLGERASHGCVRLLVEDAKWIYDACPAGTPVTIFEGESDPEYTMTLKPQGLNWDTMLPAPRAEPTPEPVYDASSAPEYARLLKKGVQGRDVYYVQKRLAELGYYKGTITGGYYDGTIAAVQAFQKENWLEADGITGEKTYAALFGEAPVTAQGTVYTPEEDAAPAETPIPEGFVENYVPMTPVPQELRVTPAPAAEEQTPPDTPQPAQEDTQGLQWLSGAVG